MPWTLQHTFRDFSRRNQISSNFNVFYEFEKKVLQLLCVQSTLSSWLECSSWNFFHLWLLFSSSSSLSLPLWHARNENQIKITKCFSDSTIRLSLFHSFLIRISLLCMMSRIENSRRPPAIKKEDIGSIVKIKTIFFFLLLEIFMVECII